MTGVWREKRSIVCMTEFSSNFNQLSFIFQMQQRRSVPAAAPGPVPARVALMLPLPPPRWGVPTQLRCLLVPPPRGVVIVARVRAKRAASCELSDGKHKVSR